MIRGTVVVLAGVVALGAGCSSKAPREAGCADIADKLSRAKPASEQAMVQKLLPAILRSCAEDAWPDEAMDCFEKAPATTPALAACDRLLPKRVQDAITARQQAVK